MYQPVTYLLGVVASDGERRLAWGLRWRCSLETAARGEYLALPVLPYSAVLQLVLHALDFRSLPLQVLFGSNALNGHPRESRVSGLSRHTSWFTWTSVLTPKIPDPMVG